MKMNLKNILLGLAAAMALVIVSPSTALAGKNKSAKVSKKNYKVLRSKSKSSTPFRSLASTQPKVKKTRGQKVDDVRRMLASPGGAMGGGSGMKKPLEVRGQSRQLSMMLVLKNSKERIQFVNVRENYNKEILDTEY